ncbi:molybdenum cofactor guanylyltransferase, partial [Paraclostridium benzoelyticum]|nr:molybdenum cofactor guanylyltransferase [Paraclostridium benzoelyticum]
HIGLKSASSEYVYFLACDMPNIDNNYIKFLKENISTLYDVYITKVDKFAEPFHGVYKKSLYEDIEKFLLMSEKKSINRFLDNKAVFYLNEDDFNRNHFDLNIFTNLNNQEDLKNFINEVGLNRCY